MVMRVSVAIVEDVKHIREGLASLIEGSPGFEMVGCFGSMDVALPALDAAPPELLLADLGLPGISGIDGIRHVKERHPSVQVLVLTVYADDDHIFEAICAGASGYLLKDTPPARLLDALRELHSGGAPMTPEVARRAVEMFRRVAPPRGAEHGLTPRELELLKLLADGHSYKTAAATMDLSVDTVRFHIRHVYEKLHVHSKSEAVTLALRRGILR